MEITINISVAIKGNAIGTLGWFNDLLTHSELVIRNCRDGQAGMFLAVTTKDGKKEHYFICKCFTYENAGIGYQYNDNYMWVAPVSDYHNAGLFDVPLTPACKTKVKELIETALNKFAEYWESK